jgi:hypothetical protein
MAIRQGQRGIRWTAAMTGLATLGALLVSAPAALSAPTPALPSTAGGVHGYTGIHSDVGHTFTAAELKIIAAQSDIVVALPIQINAYGKTLRADNPQIQFYVYLNGMFGQKANCSSYPASWKLHSASGADVVSTSNHNCLMNPFSTQSYGGSNGWTQSVVAHCKADLAQEPTASGCFLDQMSSVGVSGFVSAMPINPTTKKPFTTAQYLAAVASVGNAAAGVTQVIGNSYESGRKYFSDPTSSLDSSKMGMLEAEHWLGSTQPRDAQTLSVWQQAVQMEIDSQAHGKGILVNFGDVSTSLAQWQAFNVASMMLGNNGRVWFHFDSSASSGPHSWQLDGPLLHMRIGSPTETHTTVGGYLHGNVYSRTFSAGLVLVNPGGSTVTVTLPHPYTTPTGGKVSKVTLTAYSGTVLSG